MTYIDGKYVPYTARNETHPNWDEAENDPVVHRRFTVTLRSTQILESFRKCVKKDEYSDEELFVLFKTIANQINRKCPEKNIDMWKHIKLRTEKAIMDKKKKYKLK